MVEGDPFGTGSGEWLANPNPMSQPGCHHCVRTLRPVSRRTPNAMTRAWWTPWKRFLAWGRRSEGIHERRSPAIACRRFGTENSSADGTRCVLNCFRDVCQKSPTGHRPVRQRPEFRRMPERVGNSVGQRRFPWSTQLGSFTKWSPTIRSSSGGALESGNMQGNSTRLPLPSATFGTMMFARSCARRPSSFAIAFGSKGRRRVPRFSDQPRFRSAAGTLSNVTLAKIAFPLSLMHDCAVRCSTVWCVTEQLRTLRLLEDQGASERADSGGRVCVAKLEQPFAVM